jgi:hypothetical protein
VNSVKINCLVLVSPCVYWSLIMWVALFQVTQNLQSKYRTCYLPIGI